MRIREVTRKVVLQLAVRLDCSAMGLFAHHNFRSVSEQAVSQKETWARRGCQQVGNAVVPAKVAQVMNRLALPVR